MIDKSEMGGIAQTVAARTRAAATVVQVDAPEGALSSVAGTLSSVAGTAHAGRAGRAETVVLAVCAVSSFDDLSLK